MTSVLPQLSSIAASAVACACLASASAWAAQSSAYAVSADLTTDGAHVQFPPQLATSDETTLGQIYDKPLSAPLLLRAVRLLPRDGHSPVLAVVEQRLATDASGSNLVDTVNTAGTSRAASGVVSLSVLPRRPYDVGAAQSSGALPDANADDGGSPRLYLLPALRVAFSQLEATASYSRVFPGPARRSGSARVGEITLSGPLVGAKPVHLKGDIAPNTVVVNTPNVKITLNAQSIPQQPVCKPGMMCPMLRVLETVETQAVQIQLTHATVHGHDVSGTIVIGEALAGE